MNSHAHPIFADVLDRYTSGGSRAHKSFVSEAVRGRKAQAHELLDAGVRFLRYGIEARVDRNYLIDTAKGLYDEVSSLVGLMRKDLSDERLPTEGAEVDCAELEAVIAKLEA